MIKRISHRVEGTDHTFIDAEFDYYLGGYNLWTHEEDKRGYYAFIRRVERKGNMCSFTFFDGRKFLLKEVKRKSKKAEAEAEKIFNENYMKYIKMVYPTTEISSGCTII